jgi:hypothetical protein
VVEEEDVNDDAEALTDKARALIEANLLGLRGDDKSTDTFRKAQHRFVITAYARWAAYLKARDLKSFTVLTAHPRQAHRHRHQDAVRVPCKPVRHGRASPGRGTSRSCTHAMTTEQRLQAGRPRNSRDVERVQGLPPEERSNNFGYMLTTDAEDALTSAPST